jgi:hypothetical protein
VNISAFATFPVMKIQFFREKDARFLFTGPIIPSQEIFYYFLIECKNPQNICRDLLQYKLSSKLRKRLYSKQNGNSTDNKNVYPNTRRRLFTSLSDKFPAIDGQAGFMSSTCYSRFRLIATESTSQPEVSLHEEAGKFPNYHCLAEIVNKIAAVIPSMSGFLRNDLIQPELLRRMVRIV